MVSVNNRAIFALRQVLDTLRLRAEIERSQSLRGPSLDVRYGEGVSRLVPVWAGTGYPKDVTRALQELNELRLDPGETPVLAVREMSSGAANYLEDRGVSWVDERGRAMVSAPPALLVSRGPARPHRTVKENPGEMAWAEGSGAVGEWLLTLALGGRDGSPLALPPGGEIAGRLGVSTALVSRTLAEFDALEWTVKSGAERGATAVRHLVDPTAMLSSWARWHSHRRAETLLAHALFQDPLAFVRERIAPVLPVGLWAITGWLALEQRAPFVTSIPRVTIYLDPEVVSGSEVLPDLLKRAELREVDRGARVAVVTSDRYATRTAPRGHVLPLVSDIRLYGDLLREGVRGPDAAEHLRETVIGF